jgi:hypothetical protein
MSEEMPITKKHPWLTEDCWKANTSQPYPDAEERDDYDKIRCGPIQWTDGAFAWCNDDTHGHIKDGGSDAGIGGYCSYCGEKV